MPAPDMDDLTYLEEPQEEAGNWPNDEEQDEICKNIMDDVDNDPRPESAKDAETWKYCESSDSEEE